jgi:outer membrane protein assembly factor BamB
MPACTRVRSLSSVFSPIIFFVLALLPSTAFAGPTIALSKKIGPPTSKILVSGTGFEPNVGVDIFFDTKDETLVVTNGKGEFRDAAAYAPKSALPGEHWVTALERNNDKGDQEPFVVNTDWARWHFDTNNQGLNPYENVLNTTTVGTLDLDWSYDTTSGIMTTQATVAEGLVYFAAEPGIYALNAGTGVPRWIFRPGESTFCGPVAVREHTAYTGCSDGTVKALSAGTGTLLWTSQTGNIGTWDIPVVEDGTLFVGSLDRNVYAFDAVTGTLRWIFTTGNEVYSVPAIVDGIVYIGSTDTSIYALNAVTGSLVWTFQTGSSVFSSPAVVGGVVYVGSSDDNIYALNAATGNLLWKYTTGNEVVSSAAVANGVVYIGSGDHSVYALDAFTGVLRWSFATGAELDTSPAVADGVVYIAGSDGYMYALGVSTGTLLWRYATCGGMGQRGYTSSSAVTNGSVFIGTWACNGNGGELYAFSLPSADAKEAHPANRPDTNSLQPDLTLRPSKLTTPAY